MIVVIIVRQIVVELIHHQEFIVRCYNLQVNNKISFFFLLLINHFIEQQRSSSPLSTDIKLSSLDQGNINSAQNRHYCSHPDCNKVKIIIHFFYLETSKNRGNYHF
jgi:hypothetical protein